MDVTKPYRFIRFGAMDVTLAFYEQGGSDQGPSIVAALWMAVKFYPGPPKRLISDPYKIANYLPKYSHGIGRGYLCRGGPNKIQCWGLGRNALFESSGATPDMDVHLGF